MNNITNTTAGLTEAEAQLRLKTEGYNELPMDRGRSRHGANR